MQEVCALPKCSALLGAGQTPPQKSGCEAGPGGGLGGVPAMSPPPPSPGYPQMRPAFPKAIRLRPSHSVEAMSPLPGSPG